MSKEMRSRRKARHDRKVGRVELPPFLHRDQTRFLFRRINDAARNNAELGTFRKLVRRGYSEAFELEILYRDLPGVLRGERDAIGNFRAVLEGAAGRIRPDGDDRSRRGFSLDGRFASAARLPCDPTFFIRPDRIYYLALGIELIAGGNDDEYGEYRRTLHRLWQRTEKLDRLLQTAHRADASVGRDRFGEHMRLLARNFGATADALGEQFSDGPAVSNLRPGGFRPDGEEASGTLMPPPGGEDPQAEWSPEPEPPPGMNSGFCEDLRDACRELIAEGISGAPLPNSVSISGIGAVSSAECDSGVARVTITGTGFGNAQPANVVVVIDQQAVDVESWSDTEIVVLVPDNLGSGCVGFRDEDIEAERRRLHGLAQQAWENLNTGLRCLEGVELPPERLPYSSSRPPCTDANFFTGTMPEIIRFRINGGSDIVVPRGTELVLNWRVDNAEHIRIMRTSADGPGIDIVDPPGNVRSLGAFNPQTPAEEATYELLAWNSCGEIRREVRVRARVHANLQILGVELVQVIQRFDVNNPTDNNSVPLVAQKNTVARVYLDPGTLRVLKDVTGRIRIRQFGVPANEPSLGEIRPFNEKTLPDGSVVEGYMDVSGSRSARGILETTLNFLLPFNLLPAGGIEFEIEAYLDGRRGDVTWGVHAEQTVLAFFHERLRQKIVPVLVRDTNLNIAPPSRQAVSSMLREINTRLPVATDGFIELFVNGDPFFEFETGEDFTKAPPDDDPVEPWANLLDELADFAGDFPDNGEIWLGFLDEDPRYNGIGGVARFGYPYCVGQVWDWPVLMTHEFVHTFGVGHSQCGSGPTEHEDPSLPLAVTEDFGMHPLERRLYPPGTKELMCWHIPKNDPAWPSIVLWELMFNVYGWAGVP